MLNFIGNGSAFNTKLGNTSAFVRQNNSLLIIDCGGTVFHRLQELNLLEGINNLYILITHTHPDHVGSLGDIIFYSHYILKIKPTIFFPDKKLIEGLLTSLGVRKELYYLNNSNEIVVNDEELGEISVKFLLTSHVDTIPAYGFIMKLKEKSFYYSGDANVISSEIINKFINGEIYRIYQDTCGIDYTGNGHLSLKKLSEMIPQELRDRVYCMHLDNNISQEDIKNKGFNFVEIYK